MTFANKVKAFYHEKKDFVWLFLLIIVVFYFFSGGGSSPYMGSVEMNSIGGGAMMKAAPEMARTFAAADMDEAMIAPTPSGEPGYIEGAEKKIRKTANMQVEVEKSAYSSAKGSIDVIIEANNGFYTNKNEYKNNWAGTDYKTYHITFKVPTDNFENTIESLKQLGDLMNLNVGASDLTTQYYDIEADMESKKKIKAKVEALLERADDISDIITIEDKLANLQNEIDNLQKRLTNIDRQTDYSTISMSLSEKHELEDTWYEMTPFKKLVENVIRSFDRLFVWVSEVFGYIVAILVLLGLYKIYKKVRR